MYVHLMCQPQMEHHLPTEPKKAAGEGYPYVSDHLQAGVFRSVCVHVCTCDCAHVRVNCLVTYADIRNSLSRS